MEACCELTVWDHNTLSNQYLGGVRLSLGTGGETAYHIVISGLCQLYIYSTIQIYVVSSKLFNQTLTLFTCRAELWQES